MVKCGNGKLKRAPPQHRTPKPLMWDRTPSRPRGIGTFLLSNAVHARNHGWTSEIHKLSAALDRRGQEPRSTSPDGILYTESVQAHWTETTVGKHGELVLETVPFEPGQPVEVLVVSKTAGSTSVGGRSLRDSVLEFHAPLEPVASEDWDALQ